MQCSDPPMHKEKYYLFRFQWTGTFARRPPTPDHPESIHRGAWLCRAFSGLMVRRVPVRVLPVEWSTGPPPLWPNREAYRSGYAFSRAAHRSEKWSFSLFISIFNRWSTFSALDEQFWSSSNLSS